jgi:hypothetical protein
MKLRRPLLTLTMSYLVFAPSVAFSQEGADRKQSQPADEPGPAHKQFGELAGNWDVVIQYTIGDKQFTGKANCEAKLILDGRYLQQDYNSQFQGKPYHVIQLLGYDSARKKSIEIKVDNRSTGLMHNEGSISADGKVITNEGEHLDPSTQKPYKLRTVTTIVDHDHFTLEWFHIKDGGQEEKVVSMTHTRKMP